jgi:hypothetical protein
MQNRLIPRIFLCISVLALLFAAVIAQQQQSRNRFDINNYKIDATLLPNENRLQATVDVTFTPIDDVRTVSFELNGSLKVDNVTRERMALPTPTVTPTTQPSPTTSKTTPTTTKTTKPQPTPTPRPVSTPVPQVTFIQDQAGTSDLGPSVRVDLGETVTAGTPVLLRFKYSGNLITPDGGPLATKRLAYIGDKEAYLMYAGRWFPFHEYAADRATSDITITAPNGWQVVGYSDSAVTPTGNRYRFVQSQPALVGNFAAGKFTQKTLRYGGYELNFYTKPGGEDRIPVYGEQIGKALEFYTKQYGAALTNNRLNVVQIDDESLDYYTGLGMLMMASELFTSRTAPEDRLQREIAFQWWGQIVGLKSFDDAWLAQGLAEWSSVELRESNLKGAALDTLNRELLERALTFEQTASILRAPGTLDDQSTAYQYIMYGKGAFVYRLLRDTLGKDKFNKLLRTYLQRYRNQNASIDDFEKLSSEIAGIPLRYFFARWVEGTGVPEFTAEYQIIRTRSGKFIARGTVKQNYDNLRLPVEVLLRSEGDSQNQVVILNIEDTSEDFNLESNGQPLEVIIDPNYKLLRISDELRVSAVARRGIELYKDGNYAEAQQQLEAALKLNRSNSWVYYHLGMLFLEQRNYDLAIDNFKAALNGDLRPGWLQVWSNIKMGNAYDAKGDRTRAVAAYKRAEATGDNYDNAQDAAKKYLESPFDPKNRDSTAVK